LLLEHSPVYTIGRTRDQSSLGDASSLSHPVIEISRGGEATYHGPGQLVAYPLFHLKRLNKDLHKYLRILEEILIECCTDYGVGARQAEDLTGVWVENRKIASIGIGVKKWTSMHGIAINITPESLSAFQSITPCGIQDVRMTCLWDETDQRPTTKEFGETFARKLSMRLENLH